MGHREGGGTNNASYACCYLMTTQCLHLNVNPDCGAGAGSGKFERSVGIEV